MATPEERQAFVDDVADINGSDFLEALYDLALRCGATHIAADQARDDPKDPGWFITLRHRGEARSVENFPTLATAALAMSIQLLRDARCKCGQPVVLYRAGAEDGCWWRLNLNQWTPSCNAPTIYIPGDRPSRADIEAAYKEHLRKLKDDETGEPS